MGSSHKVCRFDLNQHHIAAASEVAGAFALIVLQDAAGTVLQHQVISAPRAPKAAGLCQVTHARKQGSAVCGLSPIRGLNARKLQGAAVRMQDDRG